MTKAEFEKKVNIAVEIEYEDGGRHWEVMKDSEVQEYIDNEKANGNYLSDIDYAGAQEPEVREILDAAYKLLWKTEGSKKFTNLDDAINSMLEQDAPKQGVKVWTDEEIKRLVQENDTVLYRALLNLYNGQTESEKNSGTTKEYNGVGFNSYDSKFLTSAAEFLKRTGFLTDKQKVIVRKKMVKYTKQLTRIANNIEQERRTA